MGVFRPPSPAAIVRFLRRQAQAQQDRLFLWLPVAMGCGAALYLLLPAEPGLWARWGVTLAAAALLVAAPRSGLSGPALTLAACLIAGVAAGAWRTVLAQGPIAPAELGVRTLRAYVVDVESPGAGGPRLLLAPVRLDGLAARDTPIRVRATFPGLDRLPEPGTAVRFQVMIHPPPPPASPGAYDFARDAYFKGIGGVGLALTTPSQTDAAPAPARLRWEMELNRRRWRLARDIAAQTGPEEGGLAAAMITGHEAFIPPAQVETLRVAGLAHIISISGLHMAIVGGFTFAGLRLAMAAWPWLALSIPTRKWAAAGALAAVLAYLLLSGSPSPAQRAAITAAAMFGAVLFDRRAIHLHTLAAAALCILLFQPQAVAEPGFQMSFAATAALVALADAWPRPIREINTPWGFRILQAAVGWIAAALAASLVAGLATGPFAIQHFNRIATYGLAANLVLEPVASLVLMPALAMGAILTPFHAGQAPLAAAGLAVRLILQGAAMVGGWPGSQVLVASAPDWTLAASFFGILWVCLWRGVLRWAGLPLALAVTLAPRPAVPDVWVAADGAAAAVRQGRTAILLRPDVKVFAAQVWMRRRGLAASETPILTRNQAFDCDAWSCAPRQGSRGVAVIWTRRPGIIRARLAQVCGRAGLILVRGDVPAGSCPSTPVLDRRDMDRGGSAEIYRTPGGWKVVWAQPLRGDRPWTRGSVGDQ